jgi:hypothetical protein
MEFYLIEELDFHLIIFHPYRSLVQLCGRDGGPLAGGEQGRASRAAMLEMDDTALQMAWYVPVSLLHKASSRRSAANLSGDPVGSSSTTLFAPRSASPTLHTLSRSLPSISPSPSILLPPLTSPLQSYPPRILVSLPALAVNPSTPPRPPPPKLLPPHLSERLEPVHPQQEAEQMLSLSSPPSISTIPSSLRSCRRSSHSTNSGTLSKPPLPYRLSLREVIQSRVRRGANQWQERGQGRRQPLVRMRRSWGSWQG